MTHIQKALNTVGDRGRYQYILLFIFIVIYTELSLILLGSSFIYMNPIFDCPDAIDVTQDQACSRHCPIVNDYTATYYAGLYCEKQTQRSFVQSTVYIGSILGLLLITPFADTIGKKKLFVLSQGLLIIGIVTNMTGIYSKLSAIMIIGQIIIGASCYTILIVGYVIISELTEDKFKQYSIVILNLVWALAQILISAFYFWYNYWANFIIFIVLIPNIATCIAVFFFLVESPYFLIQKKKDILGALASMQMIAKVNKINESELAKVEQQFNLAIKECYQNDSKQTAEHLSQGNSRFAIFKDKKHLKILLTVAILQFGCNAYYYGVQFSLGQIGTNFGNNIFLTGVIQTSGFFIANAFITKLPRRIGLLVFNLICIGLGLLFFADFGSVLQTVLLGSCRLFNTFAMALIPMMQNEPFPHKYRSVAWGYIQGFSQFGNFITPYIVTGCQNANINPLIIFSFMLSVIGTVPLLMYRETVNLSEDKLLLIEEEEDLKESMLSQQMNSQSHEEGHHAKQ